MDATSWQIDDTLGNNDGFIQPGEKIKVNMTLTNLGMIAASNIQVSITSDNEHVVLTNYTFTTEEIGSGEDLSYHDLVLGISSEIECGTEFTLVATATHDAQVNISQQSFKIGKRFYKGIMSEEEVSIPDDDPQGITSELQVPFAVDNSILYIPIEIIHPFVGDLKITLTNPAGGVETLFNQTDSNQGDLKGTFGKNLEVVGKLQNLQISIPGTWILQVSDYAEYDLGILKKWGVELEHMICEE